MNNPTVHEDKLEQALQTIRAMHPDAEGRISNAFERGAQREPRRQEVFVHPEFPFSENVVANNRYSAEIYGTLAKYSSHYRRLIAERLENEKHVTVLTYGGEHKLHDDRFMREWALRYPKEIAFQSHFLKQSTTRQGVGVNGCVDERTLHTIIDHWDGLHPKDSYLIHGADYADCVTDCAEQLAVLTLWKTFLPPELEENLKKIIMNALRAEQKVQETRMRLGIVFDARNTYDFLLKEERTDELQMLLIGEETKIIPSRDRKDITSVTINR